MRLLSLLAFLLSLPAFADAVRTPHVTAEAVAEYGEFSPRFPTDIGIRLEMAPHWHTYWEFPGDSGLPTKVQWTLPPGWKVSAPRWPIPERISVPPLVNFGYSGEALITFALELPEGTKAGKYDLTANVSWLVCKEECIPEKAELHLRLTVDPGIRRVDPTVKAFEKLAFTRVRAEQPRELPAGVSPSLRREDKRIGIDLGPGPREWLGGEPDFFPLAGGVVDGKNPPRREGGVLWLDRAEPFDDKAEALRGILVVKSKERFAGLGEGRLAYRVGLQLAGAAPAPAAGAAEPGLALAVFFAFVGGLLLNLMPCVFPVLGIKVMALLENGAGNAWRARLHGKVYALGVLCSFWILTALLLALRGAGQAVGWGFQLQRPGFVIALAFLFLGLAGNLGGFFEVGGRWMGFGARLAERGGWSGSFFTGVLAVVVATPCSAPFMGSAIGLVLTQSAWAVFAVFTALGAGLSAPFVLLAYWPWLLRHLPRPGAWMVKVKELFAFPMLATVVWLLWVLGQQVGLEGMLVTAWGLLLLSLAAWVQLSFRSRKAKAAAFALAVAALGVGFSPARGREAKTDAGRAWAPYSDSALGAALGEGRDVLVDFTAAWCLTCQVNKKLVLDRPGLAAFFLERKVVLLTADWTNRDPEITNALARYGRIGVPLYLVFRKGGRAPRVLPQILTESIVKNAFDGE